MLYMRKEIITQTIATILGGIILVILGVCWKAVLLALNVICMFFIRWPIALIVLIAFIIMLIICVKKSEDGENNDSN